MNSYQLNEIKPIIEEAINTSQSMREAASKTTMNSKTFFKYAKLLGLFTSNQSGKGINKKMPITPLIEILEGNHPNYHTFKLKRRLLEEKIKPHQCEKCNQQEWLNYPIPLELHHIDGCCFNHRLENLQLLCPNCHALTNNYRGKNKKKSCVSTSFTIGA